jgi:chymotrypsin-like protease
MDYVGLKGIISGYGKLGDSGPTTNFADFAYYEILPLRECQNLFLGNYTDYSSCLCGKGIGASSCQGDSGQGLILYKQGVKKIIGIVSKGFESCEIIEPEVFTRVDKFMDFIESVIKYN